jgi:hypothetical protein
VPCVPDPVAVVEALRERGAAFVVIGGFAVIAHNVVRTTVDTDILIPDEDPQNDAAVLSALESLECDATDGLGLTLERLSQREHLRVESPDAGVIDIMRGGLPPLDFASVSDSAEVIEFRDCPIPFASLASLVAFKRLANRPRDREDLAALELRWGPLPEVEPG